MSQQVHVFQYLSVFFGGVALLFSGVGEVCAQALSLRTLENGTQLIHIAQPLAQSTAVAWFEPGESNPLPVRLTGGSLTLVTEVEEQLSPENEDTPVSPVVVAVGGASPSDLEITLARIWAGRTVMKVSSPATDDLVEGATERRLSPPGTDATLRLGLAIPRANDVRRNAILVLAEMLPELLQSEVPGLQVQFSIDRVWVEARVDSDLAEMTLRRVRLALARLSESPQMTEEQVAASRVRLETRRRAALDSQTGTAVALLELWQVGGEIAIRHHLFGLAGVTLTDVRNTAREWLSQHPGSAILALPPRVFSPRFASPPDENRLPNDISVALVERTGSPLSVLSLRPVLLPDLDGDLIATVLTRLARQIRTSPGAPGWVRVRTRPPVLELAAPPEGFAELCEVLGGALRLVTTDEQLIDLGGDDSRRRALQLMAGHLGLAEGSSLAPAGLLDPGNLAIGAVVPDQEEAWDAFAKFLVPGLSSRSSLGALSVMTDERLRVASPGQRSTLAIELPVAGSVDSPATEVALALLSSRFSGQDMDFELLRPLVPGREVVVLLGSADLDLDQLEVILGEIWPKLFAVAQEETLAKLRRATATQRAADHSGALGTGRLAAAVAAGERPWRLGRDDEMRVLSVERDEVNGQLEAWKDLGTLHMVGAGVLPIREIEDLPRQ